MHKLTIICPRHVFRVNCPRHILGCDLSVIGRIGYARIAPVLGIDEICSFKGFLLIIFYTGIANE